MVAVTMPQLTGPLHRNADYYRMQWLPDGYPGQRNGEEVWAHPIFGAYALKDFLEQLRRRPSAELREATRRVATAALARMQPHEGALVFWYEESPKISRAVERHYSGLTQAYYAVSLARAGQLLEDQALLEAAEGVFLSLTVPVEKGGVLSSGQVGPSIAEISQHPNSHILNGWQSALVSILEYVAVTGRAEARELAQDSAQEMARLLPLYDAPGLRNSRYGLSGFVYVRLVFRASEPAPVSVRGIRVAIPGHGELPVNRVGGRRWENHILPQDVGEAQDGVLPLVANVVRLNVVLSRVSYPEMNRLLCQVNGPEGVVEVQVHRGRYDPMMVSQTDNSWVTVARVDCPAGSSLVDVPLPWDVADLVAYPTNFAKKIDGRATNFYHMAHVNRLRELAASTGIRALAEWADVWLRYVGEWRSMPIYDNLFVTWGSGVVPVSEAGRKLPASVALPG